MASCVEKSLAPAYRFIQQKENSLSNMKANYLVSAKSQQENTTQQHTVDLKERRRARGVTPHIALISCNSAVRVVHLLVGMPVPAGPVRVLVLVLALLAFLFVPEVLVVVVVAAVAVPMSKTGCKCIMISESC